jgi:L-alanine-DL-glutamate epimerase-like enolase superfamily enzyme
VTKIKSVRAFPLQYPEPHDYGNQRHITLVRIETADGTVGWGECISQFAESAVSVKTIVENGYAPLLIGEDPIDVERLWRAMLARVWWYGPQGIAGFAISAVDTALWDLRGKLLAQPICKLLGQIHPRVLVMASIHLETENLDGMLKEFSSFHAEGYQLVKGGWGKTPATAFGLNRKRDLELARRIREVIGEDTKLIFDILGARVKWNVQEAIQWVRALEEYRLHWIEEPLPPHDLKAHARLRNAVSTRVGTGEQEWTPEAYRRVIAGDAVDVVQMDPGRCLGITGCRKVIELIELENLSFSMHSWSSAINTAASVHLMASSSHVEAMDFKPHESPMQHELVSDPWIHKDGWLEVREVPGLGITVNEKVVQKYLMA